MRTISLFGTTFISGVLLVGGLLTLISLYWPALAAPFMEPFVYRPQLPLAEDREEGYYFDAARERALAKQPYPAESVSDVSATGNWIRIPSIGVAVPLVQSVTMADADVLATLEQGAALYPNGIRPGSLGTTFISAHSTGEPWKGRYRFAFLRINELTEGNLIHLDWEGTRYTYRVVTQDIITPTPDFTIASDRPVPTLKLMACWPLWSTSQRMLVGAELTNITKLTPTPQQST
jgi:LPXTG-site transpeptidase (sortase) family protein